MFIATKNIFVVVGVLLGVLFGIFITSNSPIVAVQSVPKKKTSLFTTQNGKDGHSKYRLSVEPAAMNSATGRVFQDRQIRTFEDKRLADLKHNKGQNLNGTGNKGSNSMISGASINNDIDSFCHTRKWGVVTTVFDPTDAILRLLSVDWCLVIVPDLQTPKDYMEKLQSLVRYMNTSYSAKAKLDRAFYLPVEEQKSWAGQHGFFGSFVKSTPWNHFARKNLGYLFAIFHKAEFIFDFDDDNYIKLRDDGLVTDVLPGDSVNVSVAMLGGNAFNHHPMMLATVNQSWARGFPLDLLHNSATHGKVAFKKDIPLHRVGVMQLLADNNPDIDAIHRATKSLPMNFQSSSAVLVPKHAYAPYNAQATIHSKSAFWGLLLPATVAGRVSDIWRSYFAQCIFADTELRLVFAPPKINQFRNEHTILGDFNAEQDLYNKAGELINYLSSWTSSETSIAERFEHLYIGLYEHGYIELEDVTRVQFWLGALIEAGYQFPSFKGRHRNVAVMGQFNYADGHSIITDVIFWAQKTREFFSDVVAVGPFNDAQSHVLRENFISVHSCTADNGFYSPLSNLRNLLLEYKNSTSIKGVLYIHNDAIMNVSQLSEDKYPFPTHQILSNLDEIIFRDTKCSSCFRNNTGSQKHCQLYRIFPDGHFESINKFQTFRSFQEWEEWSACGWFHSRNDYCSGGQIRMATDLALEKLREPDGSIVFTGFGQSDFMFVPVLLAGIFDEAASPHLKHGVWIECAFPKVLDHLIKWTKAQHRHISLCTEWDYSIRGTMGGTMQFVRRCIDDPIPSGIFHPIKPSNGLEIYSRVYDSVQ